MMKKMNKFLVSAAVCGILAANVGVSASAEYLPSFVTRITTTTSENFTDEMTEIPEESIIDISEETTISTEIISETTVPVTELVTGDEISTGSLIVETDTDDVTDIDENEDEITIPAGNGILLEDVSDSEINRQFLTIQSKGGNTFYIVIDKDMKGNENVYFMNLVDEYDLLAFSEDFPEDAPVKTDKDKKTDAGNTAEVTEDAETDSTEQTYDAAKPESGGNNTLILLIGGALLVGGGAFYYFKIYKGGKSKAPKQSVSDDDEDDETEIEDPNDDEKSETDDTDE